MHLARSNNDTDAEDDTYKLIDKFNDRHPGVAITESTLNKSYNAREKAIERSVGGMTFNPKLLPELEELLLVLLLPFLLFLLFEFPLEEFDIEDTEPPKILVAPEAKSEMEVKEFKIPKTFKAVL